MKGGETMNKKNKEVMDKFAKLDKLDEVFEQLDSQTSADIKGGGKFVNWDQFAYWFNKVSLDVGA